MSPPQRDAPLKTSCVCDMILILWNN